MIAKIYSSCVLGVEAYEVTAEVDIGGGLPHFSIVGLPDIAIKESRDRIKSAIKNSGFQFPSTKIIVNLAPADIKKELKVSDSVKVYAVDASTISKETIGREIPNTPMLGAFIMVTGILDFKEMFEDTRKKLEKKFKSKPEVIEGNIKAIERAYNEVKS